jgi:ABC-type Fe3+-hydroxamate transport system substrate-binding protein
MTEQDPNTYGYRLDIPDIAPPDRVVSLVPTTTETLFDLDLGDHLVGITDECIYPEGLVDKKFRVGMRDELNIDAIVGLRPDLVLANPEENLRSDIHALQDAGVMVWETFPRTVQDAIQTVWSTLKIFGVEDPMMYERVNWLHRTLDWVGSMTEAREREVVCRVFAPILPDPLVTFGRDTYTHDLLTVAGGTNVFADFGGAPTSDDPAEDLNRYPQVTVDNIVAAQPDVVLLPAYPYDFSEFHANYFRELDIPAAHSGQIYLLDGTLLTWHGTRLARALNEISALMCQTTEDS